MPRVSEKYLAGRRAEIVTAAARLFATNGFHATSMADIISAADLSAGAVYRYFRSKEELIAAVAETALTTADDIFTNLLANGATPSPAQAVTMLTEGINARVALDPASNADLTRIGVQVWAEALRNPELATRANTVYLRLRGHFAEIARRWQGAGNLPADADPDQVGAAMLSLVQGFMLQRLLINGTGIDGYLAGVNALLATPSASRPSSSATAHLTDSPTSSTEAV
ncbi:TetR/AcrR family transcriptional regulator [Actinoplanes sp. GCM10030250]|uniref:TetR/AcrR family transcriptional regulator n=1 Tax=Actinoplanes sp. GCM10030250 TaxID=3273376 RepID=UPI0036202B0E